MAKQESPRELAAKGIIEGKPVREWADLPYGAFAVKVRAIDPFYGLYDGREPEEIKFTIRVNYSYTPEPQTEYASKTYEIWAIDEDDAKEKAQDMFDDDSELEQGEGHDITSMSFPA